MPTKDFALSKRFYETLGFDKVLDAEVAIFNALPGGVEVMLYEPRHPVAIAAAKQR